VNISPREAYTRINASVDFLVLLEIMIIHFPLESILIDLEFRNPGSWGGGIFLETRLAKRNSMGMPIAKDTVAVEGLSIYLVHPNTWGVVPISSCHKSEEAARTVAHLSSPTFNPITLLLFTCHSLLHFVVGPSACHQVAQRDAEVYALARKTRHDASVNVQ
jgi:hypothetical protein